VPLAFLADLAGLVAALDMALPVSVTQAQRNRLLAMLREGERKYRALAESDDSLAYGGGMRVLTK
jgi:hypothetical protein